MLDEIDSDFFDTDDDSEDLDQNKKPISEDLDQNSIKFETNEKNIEKTPKIVQSKTNNPIKLKKCEVNNIVTKTLPLITLVW